jgi:hypothetical protein
MDDIKAQRLRACMNHRVNFISGTVSPCQANSGKHKSKAEKKVKDIESKVKAEKKIEDIESIDIGIHYMFDLYGKDLTVSVQPKFMGSRINMYLFRDDHLNKSYCVTRNGFLCGVSRQSLDPMINQIHDSMNQFMTENKVKMMIIDGELLPWSALGHNLIDNDFLPVDKGLETEINFMKTYEFDTQLNKLKGSIQKIHDVYTSHSRELAIEQFGNHQVKEYEKLQHIMWIHDTETAQKLYTTYHEQMRLYAGYETKGEMVEIPENVKRNQAQKELKYKPFGILKLCFDDGSESIPLVDQSYSQSEMYQLLHDPMSLEDDQLTITLNPDNLEQSIETIKAYFTTLTVEKGYEGVVIKPDYVKHGCLPMVKCRNTSYLTIIYGYDYTMEPKLSRLINSKSTSSKIKQSIKEFALGMEMLKVNYNDIQESEDYQKVLMKFLYNEEIGEKLDPRL